MLGIKERYITYTKAQQEIVDRYLEATKEHPEDRLPLSVILKLKKHIPKHRPDSESLLQCEQDYLGGDVPEVVGSRKMRQLDNSYVLSFLEAYQENYRHAICRYFWLDDIMVGVSRLDLGGNTRDIPIKTLYTFLSTVNIINTEIIMDWCNVGIRQAQKIMSSLIICNRMIEKEFRKMEINV